MCCVRIRSSRIFENHLVHRKDLKPLHKSTEPKRATGVAATEANNTGFRRPVRLTPQLDTQMCSMNCPVEEDEQHVREYDVSVADGKILLATANYNLAADPTSCADGEPHEMYPTLDLPVLSIRAGDHIKFRSMTGFENIAYGELIAPIEDVMREAEMMTAVTEGCFSTLRCTFAQGNEPDVVLRNLTGRSLMLQKGSL